MNLPRMVIFDLDGTLAPSKAAVADSTADWLVRMLDRVDVTRRGIDKAYGVTKLGEQLGLGFEDMLFLGDRLDEAGNDYPVKTLGVNSISVTGWQNTEGHIAEIVARFDAQSPSEG